MRLQLCWCCQLIIVLLQGEFYHPIMHLCCPLVGCNASCDGSWLHRPPMKYALFCVQSRGASVKEPACQCRRQKTQVWILTQGDPLEESMATYLLQYSCLENPMDKGAWWATVHRAVRSGTRLKWLSRHACIHNGYSGSFPAKVGWYIQLIFDFSNSRFANRHYPWTLV